jgi:molybdopterin molybdotransferase
VPAGTRLTALMIGLAASAGCDQLRVHPRPRAAVVVTGSEMRTSGLPSATVTRDALGPAMTGLINSLGADVTQVSYTGDNEEALAHVLAGSVADVLVVTGGSSAGPADQLHKVLADAGAVLVVDGVRCRPGRPQVLARLRDGRRVVGLPGNPFAAVAGLITLLAPLLSAWSGEAAATENVVPCPEGVPRRRGYTILAPVRLDEAGEPHLLPRTSSASLLSVAQASHLLAAADGDTAVLVTLPTGLPR